MRSTQAGASTVALAAVWLFFTGFLYLQLFLEEEIGKQAKLETSFIESNNYGTAIHCWNWIGVFAWCALTVVVGLQIGLGFQKLLDATHATLYAGLLSFAYAVFVYVTMVVLGFLAPNDQWRLIHRARENLASGGEGFRGCFSSPNADALRVLGNETYITLIDDGWQVDLSDTSQTTDYGWTYLSAPIVYKGPMPNCKFDPPIRAYCIAETVSAKNCFFEPVGAFTTIRKARQAEYLESWLLDKVPAGVVGGDYDRIFEFNSYPRVDLAEYVSSMEGIRDKQHERVSIAWYTFSLICLLVLTFDIWRAWERPKFPPEFETSDGHGEHADEASDMSMGSQNSEVYPIVRRHSVGRPSCSNSKGFDA
ncbi:hypothetical protein DIPPA_06028 [Diplonema papillatum]|nr:hypothetical protein DIPPA_06028 [Diplonema papillatum]